MFVKNPARAVLHRFVVGVSPSHLPLFGSYGTALVQPVDESFLEVSHERNVRFKRGDRAMYVKPDFAIEITYPWGPETIDGGVWTLVRLPTSAAASVTLKALYATSERDDVKIPVVVIEVDEVCS